MKQPLNKSLPLWKSTERIAAMIEKAISPHAKVEHDISMPVIGKTRKRQCDVVITFGEAPRQTVAIVEVQKRKSKPNINTFHGWYRKMQEVGAQQLVCVSATGYPQSVIDDVATRIGPTVKLLTLEDLKGKMKLSRFFLLPKLVMAHPKYKVTDIGPVKLTEDVDFPQTQILNTNARNFSIGTRSDRLSLDEVIRNILDRTTQIQMPLPHELTTTSQSVELRFDDSVQTLWFHCRNSKAQIKDWSIKLQIYYEPEEINIPVNHFLYRQESIDGVLAWVASTRIKLNDQEREICVVVKPDDNGFLSVSGFQELKTQQ